jgi:hypothetical protein
MNENLYSHRECSSAGSCGPYKVIKFVSISLIIPATHGTKVYSASNKNEYQKIFQGLKCGQHIQLTT